MIYKEIIGNKQKTWVRTLPDSVKLEAMYIFHGWPNSEQRTIYRMTAVPNYYYQQALELTSKQNELIQFIEEMMFHSL